MNRKAATWMLMMLLLTGILMLTFNIHLVKASRTIYIRANGRIEPLSASISTFDNITYRFTDNINDCIVIERSSIIIDGEAFTLKGSGTGRGIDITKMHNVTIKNVKIKSFEHSVYLSDSDNNTIYENEISNSYYGIYLSYDCDYNKISRNNLTLNIQSGIRLYNSNYYNKIFKNNITANNGYGIELAYLNSNNNISENDIANNNLGVYSIYSSGNLIFHNNFVNNTDQASNYQSTNVWDNGYPSGGNYWSDYTGVDLYSGPNQDIPGSDGIGDTPYVIDADNRDRYPLMNAVVRIHDVSIRNVTSSKSVVCQNFCLIISVKAANNGDFTETFNVTTFTNTTEIEKRETTLEPEETLDFYINWNASSFTKGNYTISAYAEPVLGETNTANNNLTDGWIIVSMIGDLTGGTADPWDFIPDGVVDGSDLIVCARCFGSWQPPPPLPPTMRWHPNCDITNDNVIDGSDLIIVARHYGESDP
jgi:parallel beta-helix repeat protein